MIREFIKDTLKYLPSIFGPAVTGLLSIMIFSKLFEPAKYGDYILVLTTVNVMGIISCYWLNSAIMRLLSQHKTLREINVFFSSSLFLAVISIVCSVLLFWTILMVIGHILSNNLQHLMFLGLLLFVALSFYDVCLTILSARRNIVAYGIFFIWRSLSPVFLGSLIVIFFDFSIEGLLWGNLLGLIIFFPFLYRIAFNGFVNIPEDCSVSTMKEILKFGFPLVPSYLSIWVLRLSDRYILEFYRNSYEVGLYSIGYDLSEKVVQFASTFFMLSSAPLIFFTWEKVGKEATENFVQKLTRYYMLITIPVVLIMCMLSQEILILFSRHAYIAAWKIVPFVSVSTFLAGMQWMAQRGLLLANKTKLIMYCYLGSCITNVILNIFLIPKYGFIAAGVTTLVSYTVLLLVMSILTKKYFSWKISWRSVSNIAVACMVAGTIIFISNRIVQHPVYIKLCVSSIAGLGTYAGSLIFLKDITNQEYSAIKAFVQKRIL